MGRPRKIKPQKTVRIVNEEGQVQEVTEVGVPGLFQPQDCDIQEEFGNNEALREYQREQSDSF